MSVQKRTFLILCQSEPLSLSGLPSWPEGRCCGFSGQPNQILGSGNRVYGFTGRAQNSPASAHSSPRTRIR